MEPRPRRLVVAVQDPALRRKLEELLRSEPGVEVEYVPDLASVRPRELDADVVALRADGLRDEALPDVLDEAGDDEAPSVVVLGSDNDAGDEVRLVAAGATAVLDTREDDGRLAHRLVELVEAESDGGLHGPEAGGSVAQPRLADFQSRSPGMQDFLDMVRRVAATDSTLLVTGETGVGKERLARAIHAESARGRGPFVSVNCGALPEALLESELFGHVKGAFTGATADKPGRFEEAAGGTVFLDEIGEMPLHLQVNLLTVLQRHEVRPVGAKEARAIDVRVLAATNRDLAADVAAKRFREDLYFRLNVISLVIPPLRERAEDVPWLVGRFVRHFTETHGKPRVEGVDRAALRALMTYAWPGNVRELANMIERAVLLCEGPEIGLGDLPEAVRGRAPSRPGPGPAIGPELFELPLLEARRQLVEQLEREYLVHHLRQCRGVLAEVASRARINPRTLFEKMRRLGLRKEDYS